MGIPPLFEKASRTVAAKLARFRRDKRGIAAVEFAMLAPVLVIAFIGTFELSEAITVNRKVTHATSTIADLVTQSEKLTNSEVENIFDATAAVLSPYPSANLKLVVATIGPDANGDPIVVASRARNTTKWTENTAPPISLPEGLDYSSQQIVIAKSEYSYKAVFSSLSKEIIGNESWTMGDIFYLRPRNSSSITFN
ncbi:MAG: hypothetical protein C0606_06905 [Hyphomicrobiales bacterium]|nr:MAG: hypothetical protein C0606_06905 [Hyphomicrobiales bacterium]